MIRSRKNRATGVAGAALALTLVAGACGGSDDNSTDDAPAPASEQTTEPETDAPGASDDPVSTDEATTDDDGDNSGDQPAGAAAIVWTAPNGTDASTIAVAPAGDQVAIGFQSATEPGAEIVVFDVAAGTEAWRTPIDDAGAFGLGELMFTTSGVSFVLTDLDGSQIVTVTDGNTSSVAVADECAQFVSGTVNPTENVAYTVVPGGFCRLDLSTGDTVAVTAGDLLEGAVGANASIQYGPDGSLIATVLNADGAPAYVIVDPDTLAAVGPADDGPTLLGTEYRDLLAEGLSIASGDRVAATPDRTTIVLLQPSSIDVLG